MESNRDLYTFVQDLCPDGGRTPARDLERYLSAPWLLAHDWPVDIIPIDKLGEWLRTAFESHIAAFDESWGLLESDYESGATTGREHWERRIHFQIADLRRMKDAGILDDPERYFGVTSPSGHRW